MSEQDIRKILKQYGVRPKEIKLPQKGYRNSSYHVVSMSNKEYNLILFKREPDGLQAIKIANGIGTFLHRQGLPVRHPVDRRILRVYGGSKPAYAGLYNYLPGETIVWESYSRKHLVELGRALSDIHHALQDFPSSQQLPHTHQVLGSVLSRMNAYYQRNGVEEALSEKLHLQVDRSILNQSAKVLQALGNSSQKQALHMDFVRGNVLFDAKGNIVGIIDLEKASYGHPLLDIARTYAFLIVDGKFKTEAEISKRFLNSGYYKRGGNRLPRIQNSGTDKTKSVLDHLVTYFLLHDFYKFLLHNPYESLTDNEHFTRTCDKLLKRNVLRRV